MANVLQEIPLANGLVVTIHDQSRLYYGDFYLVKLEIVCPVAVRRELFETEPEFHEARQMLGETVTYRRTVEQMGVPSTEIERVQQKLIANFTDHSLRYFAAPGFPAKLLAAELQKIRKIQPANLPRR